MTDKQRETYDFLLDHWKNFETCCPYSNPTDLYEECGELYIRRLPNCFDCEGGCENGEDYDECINLEAIHINEDGTIRYEDREGLKKEDFIIDWDFY